MAKKRNIGSIPGTIVYTGNVTGTQVSINYLEYNQNGYRAESALNNGEITIYPPIDEYIQWYDIRGLHDNDLMQKIVSSFKIHPLVIEDAVDIHQRPTYVEYLDGHFISLKSLEFNSEKSTVEKETVSIYFGNKFIITFQENEDDIFKVIRERIINKKGRVVAKGADYLAYIIVDYIVDNYFSVLDAVEEQVEELEESISLQSDDVDKLSIYKLKKNILKIRKSIAPLREAVNLFSRSDSKLIDSKTLTFIKDVYDHTIQIIDNADSLRDILSGLQDLYISEVSLQMNKVMQVLTIITAIFVPLSFLAGLYGMNFVNIPELRAQNGYYILIGIMVLIALSMIYFFKSRKWF
ncbi:magnesium/cobalt transporter CorA [Portibacter lacus]|uniref:Magnesium transport protein CorA n=1 Tax=Portibacter lacus TaxID=1099794 RepID=A0AA37WEB9_9BACT|nr:magnesium/cobalt transporter CorA [Portibacter lacus]GLR17052.1 magnesium and cobalt transport protein CorA [Portibacter lacus]